MLALALIFTEIGLAQQLPIQTDCRYRSVCMNYSQCFENGTKIRFCYDVNKCSPDYILIETQKCDYEFESHCQNSILDFDETDIDCGGSLCNACFQGAFCSLDSDCKTNACDPLEGVCVSKSEKTSKLKAFATRRPFDFWLIIIGLYALFFAIPFIITRRLNDRKQKEFIVSTEQKKLQNSIDIFYLMLERKDVYRAKLAYQLSTTIAEKINEYLTEKDILDLEELRQDYQKYIAQFEPKKQKEKSKESLDLQKVDFASKNLEAENKNSIKDKRQNPDQGANLKNTNKNSTDNKNLPMLIPNVNKETKDPSLKNADKKELKTVKRDSDEPKNTKNEEKQGAFNNNTKRPPPQERNDIFFVDENEFFDDEEPDF